MAMDAGSFVAKYGARTISYAVGIGLAVMLVLIGLSTCATTVKNTEVGIVVNNVTSTMSTYENGGMVLHLPFGLSTVYHLDKSPRLLKFFPPNDQVLIKTSDGTNVRADVELMYQIDVKQAYLAFRELEEDKTVNDEENGEHRSNEPNIEQILRAVTRAEVRNQMGALNAATIADPVERTKKLHEVQKLLSEYFSSMGVEIVSVNAPNFHFNPQYEDLIKQRKSADQTLVNQEEFRERERKIRARKVAEKEKEKSSALAQLKGELDKRLQIAEGEARRVVTKANQEAYQLDTEGAIALSNAQQEAAAIKAEGEQKAQAMEKLFEAYEKGGEGLVREALVKFYDGVTVTAKPYAPSDRVDQIRAVPMEPATKGGANGR